MQRLLDKRIRSGRIPGDPLVHVLRTEPYFAFSTVCGYTWFGDELRRMGDEPPTCFECLATR